MKKIIYLFVLFLLLANNTIAATTQNIPYKAQITSKEILYKDVFDSFYKVGYKFTIKNIGSNTWLNETSDQVILKSKNNLKQFPIFLNKNIKNGESYEFKIIFEVNKNKKIYSDYLYLSKNNKEISGSGLNIYLDLNKIEKELPNESILNIEPIEQKYSLNCESTSLKMALSYFGINKTEDELIEETGFATKLPPTKIGNRIVWGDPEKGYVGNYNGLYSDFCSNQTGDTTVRTLKCATGWGVNNGPIAKNAKKYLKNSYDLDNASIIDLKTELANKNPIIFWMVPDDRRPEEMIEIYTYNDWNKIKYTRTHVVLLVGYENISDETVYIFNDVANGQKTYFSEDDMRRIWERYDNNIVVVKK